MAFSPAASSAGRLCSAMVLNTHSFTFDSGQHTVSGTPFHQALHQRGSSLRTPWSMRLTSSTSSALRMYAAAPPRRMRHHCRPAARALAKTRANFSGGGRARCCPAPRR